MVVLVVFFGDSTLAAVSALEAESALEEESARAAAESIDAVLLRSDLRTDGFRAAGMALVAVALTILLKDEPISALRATDDDVGVDKKGGNT